MPNASTEDRLREFHQYWLTLSKDRLVCLMNKHVMCFCSCGGDSICCGCGHPRDAVTFFGHCLRCGEFLTNWINQSNGDYDWNDFVKREEFLKEENLPEPWKGSFHRVLRQHKKTSGQIK